MTTTPGNDRNTRPSQTNPICDAEPTDGNIRAVAKAETKGEQITIRLEPDMARRVEDLVETLAATGLYGAFRLTRASVFRLAAEEGLRALEARHGKPAKRSKR